MFGRLLLMFLVTVGLSGQTFSQPKAKTISIGFNASGHLLITKADGKRIGFDPVSQKTINEIEGSVIAKSTSGEPLYRLSVAENEKGLTVRVSGQAPKTKGNLSFTGEGLMVRLMGLELDPTKVLTITFQPHGPALEFSSNQAEAHFQFNLAVDPPEGKEPSFLFKLERTNLSGGRKISLKLDLGKRLFDFIDDSSLGSYSLNLTKINLDGSENTFLQTEITSKAKNRFQLDFKNWDGKSGICLRIDEQKKGFETVKCSPLK